MTRFTAETSLVLTLDIEQSVWSADQSLAGGRLDPTTAKNLAFARDNLRDAASTDPVYGYLFS